MNKTTVTRTAAVERAIEAFESSGGVLKMADAIRAGIHRNTLYSMLELEIVERMSRGLYRLTDAEPLGNPDLITIANKIPDGVICLISALDFHGMTTQIPHEVYVAISRNRPTPRQDYPPTRVFRFSGKAFSEGVERPRVDGVSVAIYNREKTLADCFKYRNKIGMDVVLEALRFYKDQRQVKIDAILRYAAICRVAKTIRPYLESIL